MRLMGRFCLNSFYVLLVVLALSTVINQKSSYGGIKPGVYDVTIKTSPVENKHDTWIFSVDGKFESERLGIKSEWQDTGTNTFKIKTDKKEIKAAIIENLNSLGLKNSDFSISIKEIELKGTTLENKIRGEVKTDFHISIKRPVKTGFTTSGSVNFVGKAAYLYHVK